MIEPNRQKDLETLRQRAESKRLTCEADRAVVLAVLDAHEGDPPAFLTGTMQRQMVYLCHVLQNVPLGQVALEITPDGIAYGPIDRALERALDDGLVTRDMHGVYTLLSTPAATDYDASIATVVTAYKTASQDDLVNAALVAHWENLTGVGALTDSELAAKTDILEATVSDIRDTLDPLWAGA